jgi:hypothetical protein
VAEIEATLAFRRGGVDTLGVSLDYAFEADRPNT